MRSLVDGPVSNVVRRGTKKVGSKTVAQVLESSEESMLKRRSILVRLYRFEITFLCCSLSQQKGLTNSQKSLCSKQWSGKAVAIAKMLASMTPRCVGLSCALPCV